MAGVNANWRAGKEREGIAVRIFQFSTAWIPSISNNRSISNMRVEVDVE